MMRQLKRALLFLLLAGGAPVIQAGPIELSPEEQHWIALHPVLRVGVFEELFPFEYMKNGVLHGRSLQYLKVVTAASGLQFKYVPINSMGARQKMLLDAQVDILPSHFRLRSEPESAAIKFLIYHTTSPIIVTRVDRPDIFDLDQLRGKTVLIPDEEHYEQIFRERSTHTKLIKSKSALEMLNRVKEGSADAAVATETFLMPYLHRQFQGSLEISGVVGGPMLDVGMAVRADQSMLISILEKTLKSINADQRKAIYEQWYDDLKLDAPTLQAITSHYLHALILAVVVFVSLCVLVYRSLRQRQRALRNEQEKTIFLTVMSHEIRSPMNAVLAAMELFWHTRLNEQQRHFAHLANSGANALARLLDDVLHTPEPSVRPLRLAIAPTDITALVEGVVGLHRLRAREKRLSLNTHFQAPLPLLLLDSSRLTQIFHNLLSNAIKFTDTGGIDIDLRLVASGHDGQQLQIEVRDTGIGISETVRASLFRPYVQDSQSYKRSNSTGLGLVICQELVRLMEGSLSLSSKQGAGTTVNINLPATIAPKPQAIPEKEVSLSVVTDCGLQILVVEDTLANQEVLRAQISSFDCRPMVAADATQARALFEALAYDLILMDCDLPDQDGYSLARGLRMLELQLGRTRCPIIAISALTGDLHLQRCLDAGMDAVLSKPILLGQLREVVERWGNVKLAPPSASLMTPALDQVTINREMSSDLDGLISSVALCDRPSALHFAHRMHGAALTMEWSALGQAAEQLEELLRGEEDWSNPVYAQFLQAIIQYWQALSGDTFLDVLSVAGANLTEGL